jgi:SAM-dependent methyltransferase
MVPTRSDLSDARDAARSMSDEIAIQRENERLKASWNCLRAEHLANYLAVGEQDPRINAQSILTRALLADTLWPGAFDPLIDEEIRFGMVMTWMVQQIRGGANRIALLERILACADGAEDRGVPAVVPATLRWLQKDDCPIPDYISEAALSRDPDRPEYPVGETALNAFAGLWRYALAGLTAGPLRVLEAACGSANDYAIIRETGIGAFLSYSGFDISWKNIANARRRFPETDFFEASLLDSGIPDRSFDIVFAHDVIGHLSAAGMERAVSEMLRIARREVWIHCHDAAVIPRHEIRPFRLYHRNRISIPQMTRSIERTGATVESVPISGLLLRKFGFRQDYSSSSATLIATLDG